MTTPLVATLDSLAGWRGALDRRVAALAAGLAEHELLDGADSAAVAALRSRLGSERLVLAVVAEFSRGKSELINAMFFADSGRRVLPATPGRTTMCPVELYHDSAEPPQLRLLPIETRLLGVSVAELRSRESAWECVPLDPADPDAMVRALQAVTRTQDVDLDRARALGFWRDDEPDDNPPQSADGRVAVPAWRHALINHPHPLLRRGLVVLDTPGLNAVGAEPELTLALLPSAHATVFVLGADSGVTKSDLALWRDHLGGRAGERFVVLNKIDALDDPLASAAVVQAQIERQCEQTAALLALPLSRVFPLSARDALAARIDGDAGALERSRLPALEAALVAELLPRRAEVLAQAVIETVRGLRVDGARRLADRRRHNAEQLLELRGLRGKSGAKQRLMLQRIDAEAADFERCTTRLGALRAVQLKLLRGLLAPLSSDALRQEMATLQGALGIVSMPQTVRRAFDALCARLRERLEGAVRSAEEMRQMLEASFAQLNTEFGFSFVVPPPPAQTHHVDDLKLLERSYGGYLVWPHAWRLAAPGFGEQFRRLLLSRLRVTFENAAGELEMWSKSAAAQVDQQLRERRRAFVRRRETLERITAAAGELESRIAEFELQEQRLQAMVRQLDVLAEGAVATALAMPGADPGHGAAALTRVAA